MKSDRELIQERAEARLETIAEYMEKFSVSAEEAARAIDAMVLAFADSEDIRAGAIQYTNRAARRAQEKRERKRNAHR